MPKTSRPLLPVLLTGMAVLFLISAGCARLREADEPTATKTRYTLTAEAGLTKYETCYKPTQALQEDIARNLRYMSAGMRAYYLVRHSYTTNSWTLAADVEGPGSEGEGPIALFHVIGLRVDDISIGNIQPFNDTAIEHTTLRSGFATASERIKQLAYEQDRVGIELMYGCIHDELSTNPDTSVYWAESYR